MKKKHQEFPSLFIYVDDFRLAFSSVSPDEYINYLQQMKYSKLKLVTETGSLDEDGFVSHTSFALERNFRGVGVWAVGTIYTSQRGIMRVSGRIGIDYWFLIFLIIGIALDVVVSLRSQDSVTLFIFNTLVLGLAFSVSYVGLIWIADKLYDYLANPQKSTQV